MYLTERFLCLVLITLCEWRGITIAMEDEEPGTIIELEGGFARSYDMATCPSPFFAGNSYKVIDYWPDGANIEITVSPQGPIEKGWTMLLVFSRPLPKSSRILVWNAEESARSADRYVTFVNRDHNSNLRNRKTFSITFVVEGASMEEMSGFSATISFYGERIRDASCYIGKPVEETTNENRPQSSRPLIPRGRRISQPTSPVSSRPTIYRPRPITTRRTMSPKTTPRPRKQTTTTTTPRPTTRRRIIRPRTTPRPGKTSPPRFVGRPRTTPARRPLRARTTARSRTTPRPSKQRPRTTPKPRDPFRRPVTTASPKKTIRRTTASSRRPVSRRPIFPFGRSRTTKRPTRRTTSTRATTTRTTTTEKPATTSPSYPEDMPEYTVSSKMVRKHAGKCKVLKRGYKVRNTGYDAGNDLADGNGRKYRFNVEIAIPVNSVVSDWTVKVVFAEPLEAIQAWEVRPVEHSSDGTVWLIKPREWNTQLHDDSEFLMIPIMRVHYAPPGIVYLCENGDEPTLLGNGIFERVDGGGHSLSEQEIQQQEQNEKERQERIQAEKDRQERERKQRQEEQRERERKDRERQEREERERRKEERKEDGNQPDPTPSVYRWERPIVTTTSRPRISGPRCSGRDGYPPVNPGQTRVSYKKSPSKERRPYDYNEVLSMSIMFYEAQRSGKLPRNNRIPWRGDSGLKDGCDVGHDLTGGWYDAGDHVKFGFPMAWSATTLAWGAIEFVDAYKQADEYDHMLDSLKWVADYFVKAHTSKYELWGQVGDGGADHAYWGKPEDMNMARPASKITKSKPGSELAAETAAALAAISIVFKRENPSYSRILLRHAEELYEFADKYRASYHTSISDAQGYYRSYSGFNDELVWGALWLAKASGRKSYLDEGIRKYNLLGGSATPKMFSWDDKRAGSQVLIAELTGESKYRNHVLAYQRFLWNYGTTPQGMVWLDQWGSNRYAANAAMISLAAANLKPPMREKPQLINWARKQIHLMLGDAGRSYVVGYGKNPPVRPHHRSSSCPPPPRACDWNSAFNNPGGNYFTLYGALVGGPNSKGGYDDKRSDYVSNEVATDFNAGFQSALAGLKHFQIESR